MTQSLSPTQIRDDLHGILIRDLLGPAGGPEEELDRRESRVRDRYLTGMLAPQRSEDAHGQPVRASQRDEVTDAEVDEERDLDADLPDALDTGAEEDGEDATSDFVMPGGRTFCPSSMGLTFQVERSVESLRVEATWGCYERKESVNQTKPDGAAYRVWKRRPAGGSLVIPLRQGGIGRLVVDAEFPDVTVQGKVRLTPAGWIVTLFLVNGQTEPSEKRAPKDPVWLFQAKLAVTDGAHPGRAIFTQRLTVRRSYDHADEVTRQELQSLAMLYRKWPDFAVGHGVAVDAQRNAGMLLAHRLETTFLPSTDVAQFAAPTAEDIPALGGVLLDMKLLAEAPRVELLEGLGRLEQAYAAWIAVEESKQTDPAENLSGHEEAAREAVRRCRRACARLREGIVTLAENPHAERAFRFANRAMWQQRVRTDFARKRKADATLIPAACDLPSNRTWRPFQLAFILLNLASIANPHHPDRSGEDAVADLLWFPTGGGKTEAYLGLTAFTLAMRRLDPAKGGYDAQHGLAVLMRYTLRLLTLQQFQRASALLCACEAIRRDDTTLWGAEPFRVGLWVGSKTTPNTLAAADEAIKAMLDGNPSGRGSPHQLLSCPWCGTKITPHHIKVHHGVTDVGRCAVHCGDPLGECLFSEAKSPKEGLPVMVVDEEIYRRPPALLIATVDKFAQMPWRGEVQMLFGRVNGFCSRHGFLSPDVDDSGQHNAWRGLPRTSREEHPQLRPPDLIIQDELHLISGPLGTLAALYETAVDELCSWTLDGKTVRPKIVASTATIRRADEQIRKLFARKLEVFPPQGTDMADSFFARRREPSPESPGRRYVGICAFGRKFPSALVRTYVAALGGAKSLFNAHDTLADPWMTLTGYFNSIRELAGARRLLEDDIRQRLRKAALRGLSERRLGFGDVDELTSRRSSSEIPRILERLEVKFSKAAQQQREDDRKARVKSTVQAPLDAVLATNMISVGVDVDRLGLMVVAGQPKTTSEYIQATSRVGRSRSAPGLVLTVFNWARPRDLSHFEGFGHYHETFYQHVEALSVTPLASRALDRGLSGVLVSLMRLMESRLNANRSAGLLTDDDALMDECLEIIIRRAGILSDSPSSRAAQVTEIQTELHRRRDWWLEARNPESSVLGYKRTDGVLPLLHPSDGQRWELFTCLNSLRDVEGNVLLMMSDNKRGLRPERRNGQTNEEEETP